MNKILILFATLVLISCCSFDNKSGIWTEELEKRKKALKQDKYDSVFKESEISSNEVFNQKKIKITLNDTNTIQNWLEEYYNSSNNEGNVNLDIKQILIHKKKLDDLFVKNNNKKKNLLVYKDNVISSDNKGNIYIYSPSQKKKIFKYNFYKKKYKSLEKELFLIINNNTIYIADNLGYIYAINIEDQKIIWAKNFGIPFRSNLKYMKGQIFLANQDNTIFSINAKNGNKNWSLLTEGTLLKSEFINNIALDENNLYFYNTSGSLYAVDYISNSVKWVSNFNLFNPQDDTNIFFGLPMILNTNNIVIVAGKMIFNVDKLSGSNIWTKTFAIKTKPILTNNNIFFTTSNNFAVCLDINTGKVIWARSLLNQINKNKNLLKSTSTIDYNYIIDNKIFLIHSSGHSSILDIKNGNVLSFKKLLSKKVIGGPAFAKNNLYLLDKDLKLYIFN
tara:strand:+ start:10204 stop:11547 length:1344 start_codon:yes stop_codon:yes gene_type:complete